MNYELALKLKEAGFPQNVWDFELANYAYCDQQECCNHELHLLHYDNDEGCSVGNDYGHRESDDQSWTKAPTLEELIEACGERFAAIRKLRIPIPDKFIANADEDFDEFGNSKGYNWGQSGSTPRESVANLWLALNEKK